MRAIDVCVDAAERLNRLSPGETLNADTAAFLFRRLNLLVDELSTQAQILSYSALTSNAQTGNITVGTAPWTAIAPGDDVVSATADNYPMTEITMKQYNELFTPTLAGRPSFWANDGLNTLYLWPVPAGNVIKLLTKKNVMAFADQTTVYVAANGWANALGASLAVRAAPSILGKVPKELLDAERTALRNVSRLEPAILNVDSYGNGRQYAPRLF